MPPPPEPDPTSVRVPRIDPPPRSLAVLLQKKPSRQKRRKAWKDGAFAAMIVGVLLVVVAVYLYR